MFSFHKNSYLQTRCSSLNPRLLNRVINLAHTKWIPVDAYDTSPLFNRLTSHQPNTPIPNIDPTRRPQAFDRSALPILCRELHDENATVVLQAVTSISDLVHDPEKAYQAIQLHIPKRLTDLLLERLVPIREQAALALGILAQYWDAKEMIVTIVDLLDNLNLGLGDAQACVRLKIASCLEMIARTWMAADCLVEHGFIVSLLEHIVEEQPEIVLYHLETLKSLMYDKGKVIALENGAFKIFMSMLDHDSSDVVCKVLDCLMILMSTPQGKKCAMEKDLLKTLNKLLHYGDTNVCTSAASVVMFCTVKTKAKHLAADIRNLAKRLVTLAKNPLNANLQMFAIKALTNICEHPQVRKDVNEKYHVDIQKMQVGGNVKHKEILLKVLNWIPFVVE